MKFTHYIAPHNKNEIPHGYWSWVNNGIISFRGTFNNGVNVGYWEHYNKGKINRKIFHII